MAKQAGDWWILKFSPLPYWKPCNRVEVFSHGVGSAILNFFSRVFLIDAPTMDGAPAHPPMDGGAAPPPCRAESTPIGGFTGT